MGTNITTDSSSGDPFQNREKELLQQKKQALGDTGTVGADKMLNIATSTSSKKVHNLPRPIGVQAPTLSPKNKQKMLDGVKKTLEKKPKPAQDSQAASYKTSSETKGEGKEPLPPESSDTLKKENDLEMDLELELEGIEFETENFDLDDNLQVSSSSSSSAEQTSSLFKERPYQLKREALPWLNNMFKAGSRSNHYIHKKFCEMIRDSDNFTEEQKQELYKFANEQNRTAETNLQTLEAKNKGDPAFIEELDKQILVKDEQVKLFKELSKTVQKTVHTHIEGTAKNYHQGALEKLSHTELSLKARSELEGFSKNIQKNAANIEGCERFAIINSQPEWDPREGVSREMVFKNAKTDKTVGAISSFKAMGPSFSSQAPRNRTEKNAFTPNYFETDIYIVGGKDTHAQQLSATRSAVTNEFSQPNDQIRKAVNRKLVKQVLNGHVRRKLSNMSWDELEGAKNQENPITVKSQTVNLLTPDMLRTLAKEHTIVKEIGGRIDHALSGSTADDERTLAHENWEVYESLKDEIMPIEVQNGDGDKMTVYVKLDLRYFNIPNNVMYEKMPKIFSASSKLLNTNNESWKLLEGDTQKQINSLEEAYSHAYEEFTPTERELLDKVDAVLKAKTESRTNAMNKKLSKIDIKGVLSKGRSERKIDWMKEWQTEAGIFTNKIQKIRDEENLTPEMKNALELLELRSNLNDLYLDTKELYESGLSVDLNNMDNNRSSLATRVIALGMLLDDVDVHFGCRSGKDRTGLVDIEVKLLFTMAKLIGRIPSYQEQEKMRETTDWREMMTLQSGNVDALVKANMGACIGINTAGAASNPLDNSATGLKHNEFTKHSQYLAKAATRPPTNWEILSGFIDYFEDLPIVITR